ncbi:3-hydroxyacyl-CoA dehydrogenase PaaH [Herbaspirillum sp. alder98]|uniref:3-hydroxyacyl-CoA dehydrogenase PaaH n=1 Tax=Herbaspirillum sp. alder98 TaxID=2913096 RepID=UPI001CD8D380|nr:3-hydroxyacyl-CoA dehydrogenase PaaH [Herbaspirillum sp. alder98]MCA1325207.1 3-hydroxyacyl-CoA dehydrogenase PaaC [Herbaspirillum sp. alder98]
MNMSQFTNTLPTTARIAVIGSGTMGAGIAQVAAAAGHTVQLFDNRPAAVDRAITEIAGMFDKLAAKGKMTAQAASDASARLQPASRLEDLAGAALVVEAIVENLDVKRALFSQLEGIVDDDCILASNTSSISITSIGAALRLPQRLVGMHFFNPVPLMALVEIISGLATDATLAQRLADTASAWGKNPVHTKSTPGFIVNRVARPYYAEALRLLNEQAATPATIDAVLREAGGFRMGPFELMDLIGHDVNFAVTQSVFQAYFTDPRFTPSLIQQELVNAGFLGRKSGRGFYRYDGSASVPDADAEAARPAAREQAQLFGDHALVRTLAERTGLAPQTASEDGLLAQVGEARLYLTDGRSATRRAQDDGQRDIVLVDLALDYGSARRLAVARADQCSDSAFDAIVALLQQAAYVVTRIDDIPGLAVMRTVAMLANEAADTVHQGVCSLADVDMAMQKGVNYPRGPLAWADAIGVATVATVLTHLSTTYGEDRYRVSPLIQRLTASGRNFHG